MHEEKEELQEEQHMPDRDDNGNNTTNAKPLFAGTELDSTTKTKKPHWAQTPEGRAKLKASSKKRWRKSKAAKPTTPRKARTQTIEALIDSIAATETRLKEQQAALSARLKEAGLHLSKREDVKTAAV